MPALNFRRGPVYVGRARIDCLSFEQAVERICELANSGRSSQLVVTPNIHHVVRLERDEDFREAYHEAALSLPDGWPVAMAARWAGCHAQRRVPGADLLPAVCEVAHRRGLTVAFVGGQPGAAETCGDALKARFPGLRVVFVHAAPVGFDADLPAMQELLEGVAAAHPNLLFLGLGSPRQEIFAHRHRPGADVVLGVGAALDFYAGVRPRAPRLLQRAGLEWLFRVAVEPRRLWRRYASAAPAFAVIVLRDLRDKGKSWWSPVTRR